MDDSIEQIHDNHQRTIIHIDMDCYYAQVEEIRNPSLRTKPLGIQQKNCVVTSNYVARQFGIEKLSSVAAAKKLCPQLVLVNGEDLTPYRQMSAKIFDILHKFTPLVEKLGLDENYLDVTEIVNQRINGNFDENAFCVIGNIYPPDVSLQECPCGCAQRLIIGTHIAQEIRDELYKELNITCCAGIAHNKLLAKLVGSRNKPNKQTVLVATKGASFMRNLDRLHKVTGIGRKTEQLLNESDVHNITDLQNCDFDDLKKKFGYETACRLKELSFGRDQAPVRPSGKAKSIGIEDSCRPISVRKDVEERFRLLLMRLISQVQEDGRIPIAIKIILRKFDAKKKTSHRETKQANILPSLFKPLHDGQLIIAEGGQEKLLKIVMRLFERSIDMAKPFNITLLGLAFSKFHEKKCGSSSIANFFVKKSDLEVQSVTSLKNYGTATSSVPATAIDPVDEYYRRRTTTVSSPTPMLVDFESVSDVSDFSEPETVEPSPKKSRLGLLIAKRRCLSSSDLSDIGSPSKLRVAELRLNSRDSEKGESMSPTTTTPTSTAVMPFLLCKTTQTQASSSAAIAGSLTFPPIPAAIKTTCTSASAAFQIDSASGEPNQVEPLLNGNPVSTSVAVPTTIRGNLANIPCPSGVDPNVFKELPFEMQNELLSSWRNSLTAKANNANHTASTKSGPNTLHRYFIRNK